MQKTNSSAEAKAIIEADEALKKRAARQAHKRELAPVNHAVVECTVLPQGHEKISMGQHVAGLGEVHYEEGERFSCALPTAVTLYERGFVNFEGARDAKAQSDLAKQADAAANLAEKEALDKLLGSVTG